VLRQNLLIDLFSFLFSFVLWHLYHLICFLISRSVDFCAGGAGVESPLGTLKEMIELYGFNATSLPSMALDYYGAVSC